MSLGPNVTLSFLERTAIYESLRGNDYRLFLGVDNDRLSIIPDDPKNGTYALTIDGVRKEMIPAWLRRIQNTRDSVQPVPLGHITRDDQIKYRKLEDD